jgi:hypothetical protein
MAQTKRRRQTKHRGNAAGIIESRGRTGRKPTREEKRGEAGAKTLEKEQRRLERLNKPPTWRASFARALVAAVVMVAILLLINKKHPGTAFAAFPLALALYLPVSYYTDKWAYKRRMRGKGAGKSKASDDGKAAR